MEKMKKSLGMLAKTRDFRNFVEEMPKEAEGQQMRLTGRKQRVRHRRIGSNRGLNRGELPDSIFELWQNTK